MSRSKSNRPLDRNTGDRLSPEHGKDWKHTTNQTLIDSESAANVLSDDTIVDMLRDAGIDIARRTVAKYREAMRIPSSVQRRREKQAAASF